MINALFYNLVYYISCVGDMDWYIQLQVSNFWFIKAYWRLRGVLAYLTLLLRVQAT